MSLSSRRDLISRLRRGKAAREKFVESHLAKTTGSQIRAIRDRLGMSQQDLGSSVGMSQNAISRLESLHYGRATITTLKRLAAAFDVALVVRFVPFSELVDWASSTPRTSPGLSLEAIAVPSFGEEEELKAFDRTEAIIQESMGSKMASIRLGALPDQVTPMVRGDIGSFPSASCAQRNGETRIPQSQRMPPPGATVMGHLGVR